MANTRSKEEKQALSTLINKINQTMERFKDTTLQAKEQKQSLTTLEVDFNNNNLETGLGYFIGRYNIQNDKLYQMHLSALLASSIHNETKEMQKMREEKSKELEIKRQIGMKLDIPETAITVIFSSDPRFVKVSITGQTVNDFVSKNATKAAASATSTDNLGAAAGAGASVDFQTPRKR